MKIILNIQIMQKFIRLFLGVLIVLPALFVFVNARAQQASSSKIIITEIKLGGGADPKEFVTLYNQSSSEVSLTGWKLEYAKSTFDSQFCNSSSWAEQSVNGSASATGLGGFIASGGVLSVTRSLNDNVSGSLRLIDSDIQVQDLIGWGGDSQCYDNSPNSIPDSGKSLQRYIDCATNLPIDTNNNQADFSMSNVPGYGLLSGQLTDDCSTIPPPENGDEDPGSGDSGGAEPQNSCEGIIVSELLPNPEGSDTGHEFIELLNPTTTPISLKDCALTTTANNNSFSFSDVILSSSAYAAFYNDQTGLTLVNSAGGSAFLIDADGSEVYQVDYPMNLDDDVSWSFIDGVWTATFAITPNGPNVLLQSKPCPAGQTRNIDTNRCVNIVQEAAGLAVCKPGQERNAETNRCRNITSLASTLKACAPDRVRNPDTNRCRKTTSSSGLAPCKEGQERNPETNRCRNVAGSSSGDIADVNDVLAATSGNKTNLLLAGASVAAALSYAVWEWRNEIFQQLAGLKTKLAFLR